MIIKFFFKAKTFYNFLIIVCLVLFGFSGCTKKFTLSAPSLNDPKNANNINDQVPNDNSNEDIALCRIDQISAASISLNSSVQFRISFLDEFSSVEYSCNQGQSWVTYALLAGDNQAIDGIPEGNYRCQFRAKNKTMVYKLCKGELIFSMLGGGAASGSSSGSSSTSSSSGTVFPSPINSSSSSSGGSVSSSSSSGGGASGQFFSLHQAPISYSGQSPLYGFKNQFAVTGYSGCLIGYPEFRSLCPSVVAGFSFSLPGYTSHMEYKVFIPQGTTFFALTGNLPQSTQHAVAAKLDSPPVQRSPLSSSEYENAKSTQNIYTAFSKLLIGDELVFVHSGGGNMTMSGELRMASSPLSSGRWLYIRVINGDDIYLLGAIYEVDKDKYRQGFNLLNFNASGDPE